MNFSSPEKLLDFLLIEDPAMYGEIDVLCKGLVNQVQNKHVSGFGNEYGAFSQCVLECFRLINNFESCTWYSVKSFDRSSFKSNERPIRFNRLTKDGQIVSYELYNFDQAVEDTIKNNLKTILLNIFNASSLKNDRDSMIFCLRYGLLDGEFSDSEDIAAVYGISVDEVSQIIEDTFDRLKARLRIAEKTQVDGPYLQYRKRINVIEKTLGLKVEEKDLRKVLVAEFGTNNMDAFDLIDEFCGNKIEIANYSAQDLEPIKDIEFIKKAILFCVNKFSGRCARTNIAKILQGREISDRAVWEEARQTKYYGLLEHILRKDIVSEMDELIDQGYLQKLGEGYESRRVYINPELKIRDEDFLPDE